MLAIYNEFNKNRTQLDKCTPCCTKKVSQNVDINANQIWHNATSMNVEQCALKQYYPLQLTRV